jgi:phenylalanyl-tRNA synthetase alpha chain
MSLLDEIKSLQSQASAELAAAASPDALEAWRVKYLGLKGAVRAAVLKLRDVPAADKPSLGKAVNELKNSLQAAYDARAVELSAGKVRRGGPAVDVTLPGKRPAFGHTHVITQTINELCDVFGRMGFEVAYGPELEDEWHNFDALNIPPHHPARDELDSFYVDQETMLRSQTSTVQIRVMESRKPPVRIVAPGRVYRPDTVDATHSMMFHQIEGLYVDEGVSMADLKSCVDQFCKAFFGSDVATRFRPSYFPFTEPSAEVDFSCPLCRGAGCAACRQSGWMELAGCGMVHPAVFQAVGYDSEKYTGFAFGFGIERMVMQRHHIPDIRLLFQSDARFLRQF